MKKLIQLITGMGSFLELLRLLDLTHRQGPPTQFHSWHLLAAFLNFCQSKRPLGRYQMGEELGLGGGSIRSLIKFLRTQGLIEPVTRKGHKLSKEGNRHCTALRQVIMKFTPLPSTSFSVDEINYGCHLHQRAQLVTDGLTQRDAAMRAGATGATTFIQGADPNYLTMPLNHRISQTDAKAILEPFNLQEGDVLIIGSASTDTAARLGTLAATLTLLKKTKHHLMKVSQNILC